MYAIFLLLIYSGKTYGYGYDSGSDQGACGTPLRTSRMHQPPCDLTRQNFCTSAGNMYPWHAVRRFVRENQGLMRRMYGDERHIAVLQAELKTNDIPDSDDELYTKLRYSKQHDFDNQLEESARYFEENKEDVILNTKFVYGQDPTMQIRLKDLQAPRFRPTTQKSESNTENTTSKESNKTTVFENVTESDNITTTENVVEKTTVTENSDEVTITTEEMQETTTQFVKKGSTGEILFQDVESKPQPSHNHVNYKLRGVNACPVKEEVVAPFWANNTRGEVLALLNMYPFEQYVHWEKCTFEHRQMYCREGCRCEQQYRLHRLLAYDPNNECRGIFSDWFRFPSCCVCKCYDMPAEFRVTSRSPRSKDEKPNWFKKKKKAYRDF